MKKSCPRKDKLYNSAYSENITKIFKLIASKDVRFIYKGYDYTVNCKQSFSYVFCSKNVNFFLVHIYMTSCTLFFSFGLTSCSIMTSDNCCISMNFIKCSGEQAIFFINV